uniref:Uncharacterized protein ycf33 n=1 Tax=Glaucocystis incrassata TaxID=1789788 RepID=A0A3G1IVM8_9EUKA|nr:hypothetical protein Ycf33 [Glaucocystis incrassata]ASQ40114.1 hypothetical protein Ycf33 [Glaucocystis incrassata]
MQNFFSNVLRYPLFFISVVLGIFVVFISKIKSFLKKPLSAFIILVILGMFTVGLFFTLQAMLDVNFI